MRQIKDVIDLITISPRSGFSLVPETLKSFRVFGMPTPHTLETKIKMLVSGDTDESFGIVIFDAFRCSSTLLACFAAGLSEAVVMEKGLSNRGTSVETAEEISKRRKLELIFGGELSGKPIPGGIVGNSPIEAWIKRRSINGRLLHFQSTNFAKVFVRAIELTRPKMGSVDIYVISFANAELTSSIFRKKSYDRILLISAGFFECISLEDMVLGGLFTSNLGLSATAQDDDALSMLACYNSISLSALSHSWTARVLNRLQKQDDITDLVGCSRLPPEFVSEMSRQVLTVQYDGDTPVIRAQRSI